MPICTTTLPRATLADGTLDVVTKFRVLSEAALATDSIYMRAKDTFKELFDRNGMTHEEYATHASAFISQLASTTTQSAMQAAMQWAKEEKDGAYSLALVKANIELTQAQRELVADNICKTKSETALICANITATLSGSIRDNGRVETLGADGCTPLSLYNEGIKFAQLKGQEAQLYSVLADAYRKSGVVTIGIDTDGQIKALSGDTKGYTDAQEKFALRQITSFEDSKRNHAANAVSTLIGQLLSTDIAPSAAYVEQWNNAIAYLTTNSPAS